MAQPTDDQYEEMMREILLAEPVRGVPTQPTRLLDHMFIGSQSNAESLRLLRSLDVTHVLNCAGYKGPRPSPDASPYEGLGIDYYEFKAEDTDRYDICRHFPEAFAYLDKASRQHGVVLVHCALGINRSAAVCVGYLMVHAGMPLLQATRLIKERRRVVLANRWFQRLLVRYARSRGLLDNIRIQPDPAPAPRDHRRAEDLFGSPRNHRRAEDLFGDSKRLSRQDSSMGGNYGSYSSVKDADLPTFNSQDAGGYRKDSNHHRSTLGLYQPGCPSGAGGNNGGGGKFNGVYRDLFERFDRLAESLRTAGRATAGGSAAAETALGRSASFTRGTPLTSSLTPTSRSRAVTSARRDVSARDVTGRKSLPGWAAFVERSRGGTAGAGRPGSAVPWAAGGAGGLSSGDSTRSRLGASTPRLSRPVSYLASC